MMNSDVQYSNYQYSVISGERWFFCSFSPFSPIYHWGTRHVAWPHGNTLPTSQGGLGKQIGQVTRETRDEF